jgi:primosomal protein N' (replication factor Y)
VIARVAVFAPVGHALDYDVPTALAPRVAVGARVWAPLAGRSVEGVVLALDAAGAAARTRPLARLVDAPPIPADLMGLAAWMAEYYVAPLGEVLRLMLPAGGRARARRHAALTDSGVRAAAALDGALEPPSLAALDAKARMLLAALRARRRAVDSLEAEVAGGAAALRRLVDAGLVAVEEQVRAAAARPEEWLVVARPPADGELARAPRRAALHARVAAAGAIALDDLRQNDAPAVAHARALVRAGLLAIEARERPRAAVETVARDRPPPLTDEQAAALAVIEPAIEAGRYAPFVLHGVTGSGKTEVYLHAIAAALARGRGALVLVPEISLTPQLEARFRARFGSQIAVLHSALGDSERQDAHRRIERGEVRIVVGARSAVFAPLARPGVLVVDEEHDPSFKQEEGVRYHGRDVALMRARAAGAVALLGSATPSLETFTAAREGRLGLLALARRATPRPLPTVEIVDLKMHRVGEGGVLSAPLRQALAATLDAGEQAILFLNRRGFSTFLLCRSCGVALRCRDCSVTLTYHRRREQVACHYCGFRAAPPEVCAGCGARAIERLGFGTEQVESIVRELFPRARVARLDRDTAQGDHLMRVLDGVRAHTVDVVVGTQMITKGHDFPGVTLVGVVLADHGMGMPDFRAAERTFQLLEQVAGRAGRGERAGRVLVQTYNPQHPAVTCARDHDYLRFAELELAARRELSYPPLSRLACVRIDGADPTTVRRIAEAAATRAHAACARAPVEENAAVVGPAEAPLSRLKGRTRWQLFLKARGARALRVLARAALSVEAPRAVRTSVDIDAISML